MLFPIQNRHRNYLDLSGLWSFKTDPENIGEQENWNEGFYSGLDIAVPGSWNEQLEECGLLHYVGAAWYSKKFFVPLEWAGKTLNVRIGSADYHSKVWINGKLVGENHLGFLPFEFNITDYVEFGEESNITIKVSNELSDETIPQGITSNHYLEENRLREETFPAARFDFSPFGGIHRAVYIVSLPVVHFTNIKIDNEIVENKGVLSILPKVNSEIDFDVLVKLIDGEKTIQLVRKKISEINNYLSVIEECKFWSLENPFLYNLKVSLLDNDLVLDEYEMKVGIREVKIINGKLFLNGNEIYLKGFGKHEDFPIIGKGLMHPLMVKDFELLKWINANSFRTSHYPYAEEFMFYADKKGILIIDEIPAVSLDFRYLNGKTLEFHKQYVHRLFERDYNHPSVIMWSLGNEPNLVGNNEYFSGAAREYWKEIFDLANKLDPKRPKTVPNCLRAGINDPVLEFSDILSINRYYGWYEYPGRLEHGLQVFDEELENIYEKYKKPVLMTEFGVDTIPGFHSTSDQMFTEEYQTRFIEKYISLLRSKKYVVGEHVWNFADFRTPQNMRRVLLNMKGVFTRMREPKGAAFMLKELWGKADRMTGK